MKADKLLAFSGALDDLRCDETLHRGLFMCNRRRVRPGTLGEATPAFREALRELATIQFLESRVVEGACHAVHEHAAEAPRDLEGLLVWLDELLHTGPGQLDPLWESIAQEVSEPELEWFVLQELIAEIGSDELASQVCHPRVSLPALDRLRYTAMLMGVEVPASAHADADVSWQALGRSNLVTALSANCRWHVYGAGALAAMLTVRPTRIIVIERALTRLGYEVFPIASRLERGAAGRLVAQHLEAHPQAAHDIACGALMWLRAGARCLDSYRGRLTMEDNAA